MIDCSWVRTGVSVISLVLSATASVPVLLLAGAAGRHTEPHELRLLAHAAPPLGEAGKPSQADHVVPQLAGRLLLGKPTDHRAEERDPVRGLEVDDRSADVLAGQHERLLPVRADLVVPGLLLVQGMPGRWADRPRAGSARRTPGCRAAPGVPSRRRHRRGGGGGRSGAPTAPSPGSRACG